MKKLIEVFKKKTYFQNIFESNCTTKYNCGKQLGNQWLASWFGKTLNILNWNLLWTFHFINLSYLVGETHFLPTSCDLGPATRSESHRQFQVKSPPMMDTDTSDVAQRAVPWVLAENYIIRVLHIRFVKIWCDSSHTCLQQHPPALISLLLCGHRGSGQVSLSNLRETVLDIL